MSAVATAKIEKYLGQRLREIRELQGKFKNH